MIRYVTTSKPLFESSSKEIPSILHISFADDPSGSLGAQLINCDKAPSDQEMFLPGYAIIGRLLPGDTVARRAGVQVGDCIVAVNGQGFRRFAPDYKMSDVRILNDDDDDEDKRVKVELDHKTIPPGNAYNSLLEKIKAVKSMNGDPPLILTLERYGWDARPNSWGRYLAARSGHVPTAMQMIQEHALWRAQTFPIELTAPGLQTILRERAVSEIDVREVLMMDEDSKERFPPTVYVNYGKLLSLQTSGQVSAEDVVTAFCIITERMLAKATDPRHPQTCQFIDLSGVSITTGFRVENLKRIYHVFEPNYPETLFKMVIYPVSNMLASTARTLLSFVNENTAKKFLITNSLDKVCQELGWNKNEVEYCGGVTEFMHRHERATDTLVFN